MTGVPRLRPGEGRPRYWVSWKSCVFLPTPQEKQGIVIAEGRAGIFWVKIVVWRWLCKWGSRQVLTSVVAAMTPDKAPMML